MTLRALELFCGIGGFAAATAGGGILNVGALDLDEAALSVYRLNFPGHPVLQADLELVSAWELTSPDADLWWLSPPCQPYCERGARRGLDDHRAGSFIHLMELLGRIPGERLPRHIALENVTGFAGSDAHDRIVDLLSRRGYRIRERLLCPTQLGVPSRRPRYYLAASRSPLAPERPASPATSLPLASYLDPDLTAFPPEELLVPGEVLGRFGKGFRILDPCDPAASTTCFTSGYGRSLMHAGAYLSCGCGVRRFSPEEIARLLHFPPEFRFPEGMTLRRKWHLVGNSLSVVAVKEVLKAFPGAAGNG